MEIVKKPDALVFASNAKTGEILAFPDVLRGWGVTLDQTQGKPPLEWMNDAFNRIDLNNLYLLQQGIPEWDEATRYPVNSIIKHADKLYLCIAENDNNEPSANSEKWALYIRNASEKDAGILKLATQSEVDTGTNDTNAITPKKLDEKLKKLPVASLTQKGITQLTNMIDDSEDKAVTPKGVNAVKKTADDAKKRAERTPLPAKDQLLIGQDGEEYMLISVNELKQKLGLPKLYSTTGENTDGSMTQKSATNQLFLGEFKNLTGSRIQGVTYYNNTDKIKEIWIGYSIKDQSVAYLAVGNGNFQGAQIIQSGASIHSHMYMRIDPGTAYNLYLQKNNPNASLEIQQWLER